MTGDIKRFVETCDVCQKVNDKFSKPPTKLRPIPIESEIWHQVWSQVKNYMLLQFNLQVGIDLIGPLPLTKDGNKYIITMIDYFSKWPEAQALPNKCAQGVACFIYKTTCRYGYT